MVGLGVRLITKGSPPMARPTPSIPSIHILLEMVEGYWPNLDSWLSRPLERGHVAALSTEAKKARKRAQIRICHAKRRRALHLIRA
jgi:hypothetical protein